MILLRQISTNLGKSFMSEFIISFNQAFFLEFSMLVEGISEYVSSIINFLLNFFIKGSAVILALSFGLETKVKESNVLTMLLSSNEADCCIPRSLKPGSG